MGKRVGFFFVFCTCTFVHAQKLTVLYGGDIMSHGPQIKAAYHSETDSYEYDASFQFVKPIIQQADLAIVNLEVTHAGKPYSGYPQFSAPDELSMALKTAGFDVLLTANNHSCDGGAKGVIRTLDVLDKIGMKHTGTFRNKAERDANYPLMMEKNGIRVALLNYTYGTNGLTVPSPLIINYIDSNTIRKDVKKAKEQGAEYIICTMHWGSEYQSLPNAYQKKWESYCYEVGVDMIIGSHPHVIQPIERKTINKKERVTAWSLGNYVSNQRDRYKNGGLMVLTTLERKKGIELTDVKHTFHYVHVGQDRGVKCYYMLPDFPYNTFKKGFLPTEDKIKMDQFFSDSRSLFNEHSKGSTELKIDTTSEMGKGFKALLSGFYVVQLDSKKDTVRPAYSYSDSILRLLTTDGKIVFASTPFLTRESANVLKNKWKEEFPSKPVELLFVKPESIDLIKE
jgi:poly-gamma-glutamate synthesis protein (capsule biosynthesis protein)